MSWFTNAFSYVANKVKNFIKPVFHKVKKGWNIIGQVAKYVHSAVIPKVKAVLNIAKMIPVINRFAIPISQAVEVGDKFLGKALDYKDKIDKHIPKIESKVRDIHGLGGRYAQNIDTQIGKIRRVIPAVINQSIF